MILMQYDTDIIGINAMILMLYDTEYLLPLFHHLHVLHHSMILKNE